MQENFQQKVMRELQHLIEPLMNAAVDTDARNDFFLLLGWDITKINPSSSSDLQSKLGAINTAYTTVSGWIQSPPNTITDVANALKDAKDLFDALKPLQNATLTSSLEDFNKLSSDIAELLVGTYLEKDHKVLFDVLVLFGLVEHADDQLLSEYVLDSASPYNIVRLPYKKHKIHLNKIGSMLSNPVSYFQNEFQITANANWPNPTAAKATADILFTRIARLFNTLGVRNVYGYDPALNINFDAGNTLVSERSFFVFLTKQDASAQFGLCFSISDAQNGDLGLVVTPFGSLTFSETYGSWLADLVVSGSIPAFAISYNGFTFPTSFTTGRIGGTLDVSKQPEEDGKAFLIGSATGTRLQIGEFKLGADFELSNEISEYGLYLQLIDAAIVIAPGDGDGFLQKILPAGGFNSEFDLKVKWSNLAGFHFEGSGTMELKLPIHKTILNTLTVDSLTVAAEAGSGDLSLIAAITGSLELGPFKAIFEEVGIKFDFDFPPDKDGNLGPVNVDLGFKPPIGLGLKLGSETIKGGGFLSFDEVESKYIGALELNIKDKIAIKAIGILTTKLPGNRPGYSLLLLITAEFQPIQLGFGFTLNGVGGLIALHRKMNFDALRDGVRNNTLSNILFPVDPVGNINSIISTLESTFPIEEGRFSFGPMALIGWGSPTLITAEVGLFIELPSPVRIALIGIIKALLPDENKQILKLQINFAGTIDFEAKFITFDASLFDSKLLWMNLSGDMIFRLKWGDEPAFVLSVGGFYPGFPIPPLNIPPLNRISMNLLSGNNPRLTLSTYFAVTSNTAQFGAAIDFYYRINNNTNISAGLSFDALFRFSPFHFSATIQGQMSVYWRGNSIVSIWFQGSLTGPTPWHIEGSIGYKILRINYTKDFSRTFGDHANTTLPDVEVLPKLLTALQDKTNWQAQMPTNIPQLVTVRELPTSSGDVVIHPQGQIAVRQKVVPLDLKISRFGNQRPSDYKLFSVTLSHNSITYPDTDIKDFFAPGEFTDLSEGDKLSRKSFEKYNAGLQVTNTLSGLVIGGFREIPQLYETIVMDTRYRPVYQVVDTIMNDTAQRTLQGGNAAARSPLGSASAARSLTGPNTVTVEQEQYAVAQTYDLALYNNDVANKVNSEAEALMLLDEILAQNPQLEGLLHVIPSFELA